MWTNKIEGLKNEVGPVLYTLQTNGNFTNSKNKVMIYPVSIDRYTKIPTLGPIISLWFSSPVSSVIRPDQVLIRHSLPLKGEVDGWKRFTEVKGRS